MKIKFLKYRYLESIMNYFLVILFLYAGLTKILEGNLFYQNLLGSPVIENDTIATLTSWLAPLLEILTSILLMSRKTRNKGFYLACFLLIIYTLYLLDLLFFSTGIPCTCRAFFQFLDWYGHLYFTIGCMLLVMLNIIIYSNKHLSTPFYKTFLLRNKSRNKPKTCKKE